MIFFVVIVIAADTVRCQQKECNPHSAVLGIIRTKMISIGSSAKFEVITFVTAPQTQAQEHPHTLRRSTL